MESLMLQSGGDDDEFECFPPASTLTPSPYGPFMTGRVPSFEASDGPISGPHTPLQAPHTGLTTISATAVTRLNFVEARLKNMIAGCGKPLVGLPPEFSKHLIDAATLPFDERKLGEGAFGVVYKSMHMYNPVAVKVMKSPFDATSSDLAESIRQEVEILLKVSKHDNIVQFRGITIDPPAIITEYMDLGNAEYLLVQPPHERSLRDKLTLREVVKIASHAAAGIAYLHSCGVIHRDIAARNFLLNSSKCCKLADFGFSRALPQGADAHQTRVSEGPIRWVAPESLSSVADFTTATDVFAFGVALYELLCGCTPWVGLSMTDVQLLVISGHRMPFPAGFDPYLAAVIQQCWHADKDKRPSMAQVHDHLREWLEWTPSDDARRCARWPEGFSFESDTNIRQALSDIKAKIMKNSAPPGIVAPSGCSPVATRAPASSTPATMTPLSPPGLSETYFGADELQQTLAAAREGSARASEPTIPGLSASPPQPKRTTSATLASRLCHPGPFSPPVVSSDAVFRQESRGGFASDSSLKPSDNHHIPSAAAASASAATGDTGAAPADDASQLLGGDADDW